MLSKVSLRWFVAALVAVIILVCVFSNRENESPQSIKIGVLTALTGDSAYWGTSTLLGMEMAKQELAQHHIALVIVPEDVGFDGAKATTAAQKLIAVDGVDALYSEFNPAALAVSEVIKNTDMLHLYVAAPVSPLGNGGHVFKSYLDYRTVCADAAKVLRDKGVTRVGMLQISMEFGTLCAEGIRSVFDDVAVEQYDAGETDFRTALVKLASTHVDAVINVGFVSETSLSLKQLRTLNDETWFVGLTETLTDEIRDASLFHHTLWIGYPDPPEDFLVRIKAATGKEPAYAWPAILGYMHALQIANAFTVCSADMTCVDNQIAASAPHADFSFTGFSNHIAQFVTAIKEY